MLILKGKKTKGRRGLTSKKPRQVKLSRLQVNTRVLRQAGRKSALSILPVLGTWDRQKQVLTSRNLGRECMDHLNPQRYAVEAGLATL